MQLRLQKAIRSSDNYTITIRFLIPDLNVENQLDYADFFFYFVLSQYSDFPYLTAFYHPDV